MVSHTGLGLLTPRVVHTVKVQFQLRREVTRDE
jgi:hypothetical protein